MKGYSVEEKKSVYGAKIKVIGVGGGGVNTINHMIREGCDSQIDLIVANTDIQTLNDSLAETQIQLGVNTTRGLGAGMDPKVGKASGEESYEELKDALQYADVVFIGSGLGGGTGTGAAPVVAKAAKEQKALTIGVVTTPFNFEGKKRMKFAKEGIEELKKECDSVIVIPNEQLLNIANKNMSMIDAYKIVDDILVRAVRGMTSIILHTGLMNADITDIRRIMENRGLALMGIGSAKGENAAVEAVKDAINSPLLENVSIAGSNGVLVHVKHHGSYPFIEITQAMNIIQDQIDEDADFKFSNTADDSMDENLIEVTLIATGFDSSKETKPENSEDFRQTRLNEILKNRKVSGGDFESFSDILDEPTVFRRQMD